LQIAALVTVALAEAKAGDDKKEKCYGLAMSGGAAYGAYEAGGLSGLVNAVHDKSKMTWDVVSGVSAGSFNSLLVAAFAKGDEEAMVEKLEHMWGDLHEFNVFEEYPEGLVKAITEESSILSTKPLFEFLRAQYEDVKPIKDRDVYWNCADANSGTYIQLDKTIDDPVKATIASGSIPIAFPPQIWEDKNWVLSDGGANYNLNFASVIQKCREYGYEDKDIVVDIVSAWHFHPPGKYEISQNAYDNYKRVQHIKKYHFKDNDVVEFIRAFPNIDFRYYVRPQ